MLQTWMCQGGLVLDPVGNVVLCQNCPCPPTNCDMCKDGLFPSRVQIVVEGIEDGGECPFCLTVNGTYILGVPLVIIDLVQPCVLLLSSTNILWPCNPNVGLVGWGIAI